MTDEGIDISTSDEHRLKTLLPIYFIEDGIVICDKDLHLSKDSSPI